MRNGTLLAIDKENSDINWEFVPKINEPRAYEFYSAGLVSDDYLYIGSANKFIYCINRKTGEEEWSIKLTDWVRSRPFITSNTLFIATLDGMVHAIDILNQKILWQRKISDHGFTADLSGNKDRIITSDRNMKIFSLSTQDGSVQWKHSALDGDWVEGKFFAAGEISGQQSAPTVVDGKLYIASSDGFVNAVDTETGKEIWRFETGSSTSPSPTVAEGKVFIGQTYNSYGEYFALDKDTGEPVWSTKELGSVWIGAAYANGKLFLGDMNGNFFAIDPNNGKKLWNYYTAKDTPNEHKSLLSDHRHGWPPGVYCNPIVDGNVVYTGSWAGYYFAFNQETGKLLWRTKTQPEGANGGLPDSAAPVLHKGHIYVQKAGHWLTALDKNDGSIAWEWFAPAGYLQNGTIAANGDMIYASVIRMVTDLPYDATIHTFQDVESGSTKLWTYRGGGGLTAPVLTEDKLIFGSNADPFLTCLDPISGRVLWRTHVGGKMLESVPAIYGNKVFALIKNGYLYAVE
jgi:outer membrane protein assembly factor BamB